MEDDFPISKTSLLRQWIQPNGFIPTACKEHVPAAHGVSVDADSLFEFRVFNSLLYSPYNDLHLLKKLILLSIPNGTRKLLHQMVEKLNRVQHVVSMLSLDQV